VDGIVIGEKGKVVWKPRYSDFQTTFLFGLLVFQYSQTYGQTAFPGKRITLIRFVLR